MMNNYSTTPTSNNNSNGRKKRARSTSSTNSTYNNTHSYSSNNRLLRLNVGGHPYDIIRTSLPLLETMMTDRWLDSCLLDSDGRIFLDRDGDAFGDVLRYLRGGKDFLLELMNHYSSHFDGAAGGGGGHHHHHAAGSLMSRNHPMDMAGGSTGGFTNHHPSSTMMLSNTTNAHHQMDRLRRLRTEADYYGLHQLVHDIDSITIGSKIVFEEECWGCGVGLLVD